MTGTVAIVPSAGCGKRMGMKVKKTVRRRLGGKPLIARTIQAIDRSPSIDSIIIACDKGSVASSVGL